MNVEFSSAKKRGANLTVYHTDSDDFFDRFHTPNPLYGGVGALGGSWRFPSMKRPFNLGSCAENFA